jgi:hypothetical protein
LINLSNISKREQFQTSIEDYFDSSNPNQFLLIFADMQTDPRTASTCAGLSLAANA